MDRDVYASEYELGGLFIEFHRDQSNEFETALRDTSEYFCEYVGMYVIHRASVGKS